MTFYTCLHHSDVKVSILTSQSLLMHFLFLQLCALESFILRFILLLIFVVVVVTNAHNLNLIIINIFFPSIITDKVKLSIFLSNLELKLEILSNYTAFNTMLVLFSALSRKRVSLWNLTNPVSLLIYRSRDHTKTLQKFTAFALVIFSRVRIWTVICRRRYHYSNLVTDKYSISRHSIHTS